MLFARCAASVLAIGVLATGCATHAGTPSSHRSTIGAPASTMVTAEELTRVTPQGSLMDVLARVRPSFTLRSRGTTPLVSVDGSPPTDLSVLQTIDVSVVREVRMQRASAAVGVAAIGPDGHVIVGDVIVVTTWSGPRGAR
jgi:hypothetical protein